MDCQVNPWKHLPSKRAGYKPTHKYILATPPNKQKKSPLVKTTSKQQKSPLSAVTSPSIKESVQVAPKKRKERPRKRVNTRKKPYVRTIDNNASIQDKRVYEDGEGDDGHGEGREGTVGKDSGQPVKEDHPSIVVKDDNETVKPIGTSRKRKRKVITFEGRFKRRARPRLSDSITKPHPSKSITSPPIEQSSTKSHITQKGRRKHQMTSSTYKQTLTDTDSKDQIRQQTERKSTSISPGRRVRTIRQLSDTLLDI